MMDIKSATIIRNSINKEIGYNSTTLEDVQRMQPIAHLFSLVAIPF